MLAAQRIDWNLEAFSNLLQWCCFVSLALHLKAAHLNAFSSHRDRQLTPFEES